MSQSQLFLLVEGKDQDPNFYSQIIEAVMNGLSIKYKIIFPSQIVNGTGGKPLLIEIYKEIKARKDTNYSFHSKKKAIVFMTDKDVDEFRGDSIDDKSIIYTYFYNVENHICRESDLRKAILSAASLPANSLSDYDCQEMLKEIHESNKGYLTACLHVARHKMRCHRSYGAEPIKNHALTESDLQLYADQSGVPVEEMRSSLRRTEAIVAELFAGGKQDVIFNGKWYFNQIETWIRARYPQHATSGMGSGLRSAMISGLRLDSLIPYYSHRLKHALDHITAA